MDDFDRSDVIRALNASGGNVTKAAKKLGCARRTLQNRMREYGMVGTSGRPKRKLSYRKTSRLATGLGVAAAAVGAVALGLKFRRGGGT